jgi:hypothetical protein
MMQWSDAPMIRSMLKSSIIDLPIRRSVSTCPAIEFGVQSGFGAFSAAGNGTVVYRPSGSADRELVWVDVAGKRLKVKSRVHAAIIFAVILMAMFTRRLRLPERSFFLQSGFGVYTGTVELKDGPLRVLPLKEFLTELSAGSVLH